MNKNGRVPGRRGAFYNNNASHHPLANHPSAIKTAAAACCFAAKIG
jgi:hypothetical protein